MVTAVAIQTTVCSVTLMPPTAALALRGPYLEPGSFPMKLFFLLLLVSLMVVALASAETEETELHVFIDTTIQQKEDVSDVIY